MPRLTNGVFAFGIVKKLLDASRMLGKDKNKIGGGTADAFVER